MSLTYGSTFYNSNTLKLAAKEYLDVLPSEVTGFLTRGTSGCSIASAMCVLSNRYMNHIAVGKSAEEGHTIGFVGTLDKYCRYAIVDDFMASGITIKTIYDWAMFRSLEVVAIVVDHDNSNSKFSFDCPTICVHLRNV